MIRVASLVTGTDGKLVRWVRRSSAFLGIVIGGVLTSLLSYWQERRRERMKVRTAARLIQERFENAVRGLEWSKEVTSSPDELALLMEDAFEGPSERRHGSCSPTNSTRRRSQPAQERSEESSITSSTR